MDKLQSAITINSSSNYKYSDLTSQIIGAAMEVHATLKNGFHEIIYQRALEKEMGLRNLQVIREYDAPVYYKGEKIGSRRVDFLVENKIPVELKAVTKLEDAHSAQAINYLEAYKLEVGLLINFGAKSLEFRRLYNAKYKS
ncbi:GxxExxY protein [Pontibacter pudoricolor]|uniref:GxxExxY protein n=1 Tax=Pontibacter pudoricolor TaxID=2694930 RepID=UPI001390CC8F|nr:GxxExxY protein [Pontibacter pudoricolor]